jgi:hypothetical protein
VGLGRVTPLRTHYDHRGLAVLRDGLNRTIRKAGEVLAGLLAEIGKGVRILGSVDHMASFDAVA